MYIRITYHYLYTVVHHSKCRAVRYSTALEISLDNCYLRRWVPEHTWLMGLIWAPSSSSIERYLSTLLCARYSTEVCIHTSGTRGYVFLYILSRYEARGTSGIARYVEILLYSEVYVIASHFVDTVLARTSGNRFTLYWGMRYIEVYVISRFTLYRGSAFTTGTQYPVATQNNSQLCLSLLLPPPSTALNDLLFGQSEEWKHNMALVTL